MKKNTPIEVIYADDHIVIANKPAGIAVIPERLNTERATVQRILEQQFGKLFVVHRIDKPTSGIICFARNEAAHRHISLQFQNHEVQKFYLAVVQGKLPYERAEIDAPLAPNPAKPGTMMVSKNGKEAKTICSVVEEFRSCSLLSVEIKTGRMHQIRVHLASVGHPLLVDELYGSAPAFFFSSIKRKNFKLSAEEERPTIVRITLHAHRLTLLHPATNELVSFEAPPAEDIQTLLKLLRKYDK